MGSFGPIELVIVVIFVLYVVYTVVNSRKKIMFKLILSIMLFTILLVISITFITFMGRRLGPPQSLCLFLPIIFLFIYGLWYGFALVVKYWDALDAQPSPIVTAQAPAEALDTQHSPIVTAQASVFEGIETKSHSEAVDILFSQAVPILPVVTTEDIRRICGQHLKYDTESGQRHVMGSADHIRHTITRNLERVPTQLYSGQRIIGFRVFVQPELQFASLSIGVGDAQGSPGYMFGARLWRTTDQVFVLGWEGFQL